MIEPNILAFQNADVLEAISDPDTRPDSVAELARRVDRDADNLRKSLKRLIEEDLVLDPPLSGLTLIGKAQLDAFRRAKHGGEARRPRDRIEIEKLRRNPLNRPINPAHVADIADTASAEGVGDIIVPILVSPADANGVRTIWAGEHRWEAVKKLQAEGRLPPALAKGIRFDEREATPGEAAVIALIENSSRTDLTPWQDAQQLKAAADGLNLNASELARRIGRAREGSRGGLRDVQTKLKVAREAKPHDIAAYEADPKAPGAWERLRDSVVDRSSIVTTKAQRLALAELFQKAGREIGKDVAVLPAAAGAELGRLVQYGFAVFTRSDKGDTARVIDWGADYLKAEGLTGSIEKIREDLGFPGGHGVARYRTEWLNTPIAPAAAPQPDPDVAALQGVEAVTATSDPLVVNGVRHPNLARANEARRAAGILPRHSNSGGSAPKPAPVADEPKDRSGFDEDDHRAAKLYLLEVAHSQSFRPIEIDGDDWALTDGYAYLSKGNGLLAQSGWVEYRIKELGAHRLAVFRLTPKGWDEVRDVLAGARLDGVALKIWRDRLGRRDQEPTLSEDEGYFTRTLNAASRRAAIERTLESDKRPDEALLPDTGEVAPSPHPIVTAGDQTHPTNAALKLLAEERFRQVSAEGWTPDHDDEVNGDGELSQAAAAYAAASSGDPDAALFWPGGWDPHGFKPTGTIRDLVKAGALILAEIERRQRAGEACCARPGAKASPCWPPPDTSPQPAKWPTANPPPENGESRCRRTSGSPC